MNERNIATTEQSSKRDLPKWRRNVGRLACAVAGTIALGVGFSPVYDSLGTASAAPRVVTLKAGDEIGNINHIGGLNLPGGICSIAAVGYDGSGNKLAMSAGHCSSLGAEIGKYGYKAFATEGKTPVHIGKVVTKINTVNKAEKQQPDAIDVLFIELDKNVKIIPSGKGIGQPYGQLGRIATKLGNGIRSPFIDKGKILQVTNNDITAAIPTWPGDSGGPLNDDEGRLLGIGSRVTTGNYGSGNTVFMRADSAIKEVTQRGLVGSNFKPI